MTWDRQKAARGLAEALRVAEPRATVFESPPATLNAPAYVVQFPFRVAFSTPAIGTDLAEWTVLSAVGLEQPEALDDLLATAKAAVVLDPTLGGVAQATRPTEFRNWRTLNVAGAEFLAAELALETRM